MVHIKIALGLVAFVAVFGLVGAMDYEDAVQAETRYNTMVCDGLWPDYKNLNPECK
jgi:hypothetical protein